MNMTNKLFLQLVIAVLIGIFLKFSFSKKENVYIISGVCFWLILPIFISKGIWLFWVGCLINVSIGIITGVYFNKKTIPVLSFLILVSISSSYFIGKDFFPKQALSNESINYTKNNSLNFLDSVRDVKYSLRDKAGTYYTVNDFRDKTILFDFWFVRCKPCVIKDKSLIILSDKYRMSNNFKIVKLIPGDINSFDEFIQFDNSPKEVLSLFDSAGVLTKRLKITEFPKEYLIDKNGTLVSTLNGFGPDLENEYVRLTITKVDSLLKK